jgi:hypothetical protein
MAQSKAPTLSALRAFEEARAAGVPLAEAQVLLEPAPKPKREREATDYLKFLNRAIRNAGRRVYDADPEELAELVALLPVMEEAVALGIKGQLDRGMSWAYVADGLGVKRQSAHERYAKRVKALAGTSHG